MSDKRFKSTIDEETMSIMPYLVSDNEEEAFYNLQGCVDLLNEQQATNSALRTENNHLIDVIKEYAKKYEEQQDTIKHLETYSADLEADVKRLMKENKELGKNFDDLVEWASEIAKRNVLLDEKIGKLQRENEQLKNKLNKDL